MHPNLILDRVSVGDKTMLLLSSGVSVHSADGTLVEKFTTTNPEAARVIFDRITEKSKQYRPAIKLGTGSQDAWTLRVLGWTEFADEDAA